jgi:2-C-methyl-D-erythritol 2,4-cyclodiphosphate synthase
MRDRIAGVDFLRSSTSRTLAPTSISLAYCMKIGYGWDSHEFKRDIPLKIGGITLPHPKGLGGHSDGDVLLHALTDALLGAVAAPDIGTLFSPSDQRWKGADSAVFLAEALKRVAAAGYAVVNVDSTLVLAAPKIGPHAHVIRERISELLGIPADCVGLKAKTPEGMGTDNAAIAHAVVLLEKKAVKPVRPKKRKK